MLPTIYLLIALINIGAKLNNYNIRNHPLDIRVRRDTSIEKDIRFFNELNEKEKLINIKDDQEEGNDKKVFENPEKKIAQVLTFDPNTIGEISVSGNKLTARKYKSELLNLLYQNERKISSTRDAWKKDKRSVDNKAYYNHGTNNNANEYTRYLATKNITRVPQSNIMSLYARKPYQYNNIYNRTNNTNYARAPNKGINYGSSTLYRPNPIPYSNQYQTGPNNNFTNNIQLNNRRKLQTNNQFSNNLTYNGLFYNNNAYYQNNNNNKNFHTNQYNIMNNNNNNGYDPNRNINLNISTFSNNNLSNNNLYHNNNNRYDANRNIQYNYNQINNNNLASNNLFNNYSGYDPNRNIHIDDNQINNNNNLYNNNLFINNTANNPFRNQVPPAPTTDYQEEPSTTTSTTPFIVESCILCGSVGCPKFFRRMGFLCVPNKN